MAQPPHGFQTLSSYLDHDEEVKYGSDNSVEVEEGTMSDPHLPEVIPLSAPNPFIKRRKTNAPVTQHDASDTKEIIITNPIDEQPRIDCSPSFIE